MFKDLAEGDGPKADGWTHLIRKKQKQKTKLYLKCALLISNVLQQNIHLNAMGIFLPIEMIHETMQKY